MLKCMLDVSLGERLEAIIDDPAATERTRRLALQALVIFGTDRQGEQNGRPATFGARARLGA